MKVSIIVPTYNERGNLPILFERIHQALSEAGINYEIIVVDDNSPDGTWQLAEELSSIYPVKVIKRPGKMGLASAVVDGFKASTGVYIVVMDADLQHPPEYIPGMIKKLENCDIVVASRYIGGSGLKGLPWHRRIVSKTATLIAWLMLPSTRRTSDPMSGFFAGRRSVFDKLKIAEPRSFKVLLDLLESNKEARVCDHPYTMDRRMTGSSKLKPGTVVAYIRHVLRLATKRFQP
ncbi:polyprenol monophosphomannose synthase [Thermogladius sp. 4427co]|uniref:polyprenol monophosphomannose synthase n=1 Tax=Thermogladius sp. 4427co TaxID=3450718 RepID=UPI003F7AD9B8